MTIMPLLAALVLATPGPQAYTPPRIDPGTIPVTKTELESGLRASVNDVDAMVTYLRRAERLEMGSAAYDVVQELRHKHPKNAVVASAYVFAFRIAAHGFNSHRPRTPARSFTEAEAAEFAQTLKASKELKPACYLAYAESGSLQAYAEGVPLATRRRGLADLRKAMDLAPRSAFAQFEYANAVTLLAERQPSTEGDEHRGRAIELDPPIADAALGLYLDYKYHRKDPIRAQQVKLAYLSMLAKGYVIPPEIKQVLDIK